MLDYGIYILYVMYPIYIPYIYICIPYISHIYPIYIPLYPWCGNCGLKEISEADFFFDTWGSRPDKRDPQECLCFEIWNEINILVLYWSRPYWSRPYWSRAGLWHAEYRILTPSQVSQIMSDFWVNFKFMWDFFVTIKSTIRSGSYPRESRETFPLLWFWVNEFTLWLWLTVRHGKSQP